MRAELIEETVTVDNSFLFCFLFFFFLRRKKYTLRAEPLFVFFFTEEEKSRLCPNRVNSLKPP